jgi:hypothetical protein
MEHEAIEKRNQEKKILTLCKTNGILWLNYCGSRYFLYKTNQMVQNQTERAKFVGILTFKAYDLALGFNIFEKQPIKLWDLDWLNGEK